MKLLTCYTKGKKKQKNNCCDNCICHEIISERHCTVAATITASLPYRGIITNFPPYLSAAILMYLLAWSVAMSTCISIFLKNSLYSIRFQKDLVQAKTSALSVHITFSKHITIGVAIVPAILKGIPWSIARSKFLGKSSAGTTFTCGQSLLYTQITN